MKRRDWIHVAIVMLVPILVGLWALTVDAAEPNADCWPDWEVTRWRLTTYTAAGDTIGVWYAIHIYRTEHGTAIWYHANAGGKRLTWIRGAPEIEPITSRWTR